MSLPTYVDRKIAKERGITPEKAKKERDREASKKRYEEKRQRAIELLGGGCVKCGTGTEPLHFHHALKPRKGDRYRRISYLFKNSWNTIVQELDNCILLCDYCHKKEHL